MGNKQAICCEQCSNTQNQDLPSIKVSTTTTTKPQIIKLPVLSAQVSKHLSDHQPFYTDLPKNAVVKRYGRDIYQGELNYKNRPHGFGTMYFHNGAVFIGQFDNGKANGLGHYVFEDGSYFHGQMRSNQAQCINGEYNSDNLWYKGGFKANSFQGKGEEKGKLHSFKGIYHNSKKVQGTLTWTQNQYNQFGQVKEKKQKTYIGTFDENEKFSGQGKLINQFGEYRGQFNQGLKHGKGQFDYKTGIKYKGDYSFGVKQGNGTIFSKGNSIAFSGQIKNGLPHGKGFVMNTFGDKVFLNWVNGLDQRLLQKNQQENQPIGINI